MVIEEVLPRLFGSIHLQGITRAVRAVRGARRTGVHTLHHHGWRIGLWLIACILAGPIQEGTGFRCHGAGCGSVNCYAAVYDPTASPIYTGTDWTCPSVTDSGGNSGIENGLTGESIGWAFWNILNKGFYISHTWQF